MDLQRPRPVSPEPVGPRPLSPEPVSPRSRPTDLEELIDAHGETLFRLAVSLTGNRTDAEDLWQDTIADAIRHWDKVAGASTPRAYLRTMLTHRHIGNHRRGWRREVPLAPGTEPEARHTDPFRRGASPEPSVAVEGADTLWRLLDGLPPRTRAALVLRYVEDLDHAAIADLLGITPGTVRGVISRGLSTLREREGHPS